MVLSRVGLVAVVVALGASMLYSSSLEQAFVADDFIFLHQLRFTQPNISDNLVYFVRDWGMGAEFYRPLTRLYWALLHSVAGETAWAWHLAGLVLYAITCAVVFLLALRLLGGLFAAFSAAILFVAHPAHAETVSWIANSSDILALLFCLLAFLSYIAFRRGAAHVRVPDASRMDLRRAGMYGLALLFFFAGLLSKESAAGFCLVPIVYDVIFGAEGSKNKEAGAELKTSQTRYARIVGLWAARQLPFLGVLALYGWLRLNALGGIGGYAPSPGSAPSLGAFVEVYTRWLLLPLVLDRILIWFLLVVVLVALVVGVLYWERRTALDLSHGRDFDTETSLILSYPLTRTAAFGLCWVVLFLAPTATTPPSLRFVYISTFGMALFWGAILSPTYSMLRNLSSRAAGDKMLNLCRTVSLLKLALVVALFVFSALATLPRLDAWLRAGETGRTILAQVRAGRPQPAPYTPIYAVGLPQANENALIFRTGFPEAIQLLYDDTTVQGIPVEAFPVVEQRLNEAYFVEYRDGGIISRADVVATLQERNKQVKAKSDRLFQLWDFTSAGSPDTWQVLSGGGTMKAQTEGLDVQLPDGGFVGPAPFLLSAPALSWFELTLHGTPSTLGHSGAQLVVHWLIDSPGGPTERASAPMPIVLDSASHAYKVKPANMSVFLLGDNISEIRLELPPGILRLSIEKAQLFSLP